MPGVVPVTRMNGLPIIECLVARDNNHMSNLPAHPIIRVRALIDTGATHCILTPKFVSLINLRSTGTYNNTVVGGSSRICRSFIGSFLFEGSLYSDKTKTFTLTITDAVILEENLVNFDAIIGWDVLSCFDMSIYQGGHMVIHLPG